MKKWCWKAQSSHLRRWSRALFYTKTLPTQQPQTSAADFLLKSRAGGRWLCTAVLSHEGERTDVTSENMEEMDLRSLFLSSSANNAGKNALLGYGNVSSAETKSGTDNSLVEAQSKVIRGILGDGVWDFNMELRLNPFVKVLSPTLVARVVNQVGRVEIAQSFFNWVAEQEGYKHDAYAYNALILKLGLAKNFLAIEELVKRMRTEECTLTSTTFAIIIQSYGKAGLLADCWRNFARAEYLGVNPDARMYTSLLRVLFDARKVSKAKQLIGRMEDSKIEFDLHTWFVIIQGLCKNKMPAEAHKIFVRMVSSGCLPNAHVYNAIILGFCESGDPRKALSYYERMQKQGCEPDTYTFNTLIQAYCCLQMFAEAESLVSVMQKNGCEPNNVTFNVLLQQYSQMGDAKKAEELFSRMQAGDLVDSVSYRLYCSLLRRLGDVNKLIALAENLYSRYKNTHGEVCNAILQYHCEKGDILEATKYLEETFVRLSTPNGVSYALMMNAYCKSGDLDAAILQLSKMAERGCKAMAMHFELVIMALCKHSRGSEALQLFKEMNMSSIESCSLVCERLLAVLSDAGMKEDVVYMCNHIILKKHIITGLSLVSFMKCMSNLDQLEEAKVLLKRMMHLGCFSHSRSFRCCLAYLLEGEIAQVEKHFHKQTPNLVDYTMQIQAACRKGMLGAAKKALSEMKETGLAPTYPCYCKLIYCLSKCKDTAVESLELFEEMLERSLVPSEVLPSYLMDSFGRCEQPNVVMQFCRVIIEKRFVIREGSASFLLGQGEGSDLKKLYFELKESGRLVETVPSYSTGKVEPNEDF